MANIQFLLLAAAASERWVPAPPALRFLAELCDILVPSQQRLQQPFERKQEEARRQEEAARRQRQKRWQVFRPSTRRSLERLEALAEELAEAIRSERTCPTVTADLAVEGVT